MLDGHTRPHSSFSGHLMISTISESQLLGGEVSASLLELGKTSIVPENAADAAGPIEDSTTKVDFAMHNIQD